MHDLDSYPVSFCSGEEAAAVESLRKKMMTNLDNARDRVNFLCKHLITELRLFLTLMFDDHFHILYEIVFRSCSLGWFW